jgi:hypothetical protein
MQAKMTQLETAENTVHGGDELTELAGDTRYNYGGQQKGKAEPDFFTSFADEWKGAGPENWVPEPSPMAMENEMYGRSYPGKGKGKGKGRDRR